MTRQKKMVALSSKLLGMKVLLLDFDNMEFFNQFDGIWACAIFLHVLKNEMNSIISKMEKALVVNGVMYVLYVVSKSGTMWVLEVTDTLEATALLPGGSIIVPSYL